MATVIDEGKGVTDGESRQGRGKDGKGDEVVVESWSEILKLI